MNQDSIYDDPTALYTTTSGKVPVRDVHKPWGKEELLVCTPDYAMKILHINAGERFSVQYHERKRETLHCLSGECIVLLTPRDAPDYNHKITLKEGETVHIEPFTIHAIEATTNTVIVEVSLPDIDDVVRLEDRYGRV